MDVVNAVNDARINKINTITAVMSKFVPESTDGGSALAVI